MIYVKESVSTILWIGTLIHSFMQYHPLVILGAMFGRILDLRQRFATTRQTYFSEHQTDVLNRLAKPCHSSIFISLLQRC